MTTRRLLPLALLLACAMPAVARAQYSYRRQPVWGGGGIGASRSAEQIAAEQARNARPPYVIYVGQPGYVIIPQYSSARTTAEWESAQAAYQANTAQYVRSTMEAGHSAAPVYTPPAARVTQPTRAPERPRDPRAVAADYRRKFGAP
jgi:hypothetical protein